MCVYMPRDGKNDADDGVDCHQTPSKDILRYHSILDHDDNHDHHHHKESNLEVTESPTWKTSSSSSPVVEPPPV